MNERLNDFLESYKLALRFKSERTDEKLDILAEKLNLVTAEVSLSDFTEAMDGTFTNTQMLLVHLIKNRVKLNDEMVYTECDGYGFFVNKVSGDVRVINLKRYQVWFREDGLIEVVKLYRGTWYHEQLIEQSTLSYSDFHNGVLSIKYGTKGYWKYFSVSRKFFGKTINIKVHQIVFAMEYGSVALIATGTNKLFVIDHMDNEKFNNALSNLRLTTQLGNVIAYFEWYAETSHNFLRDRDFLVA